MDIQRLGQLLLPVTIFVSLAPVGAAYFRTRPLDRPSQVIALAVFVSLVFNEAMMQVAYYRAAQIAYYNTHQSGISTNPVMHAFLVAQAFVLSRFYTIAFVDSPTLVRAVKVVGGAVLFYTLLNTWKNPVLANWFDGYDVPASRALAAQSLFFIVLALLYLYRLFARTEIFSLEQTPLFWFNAGIFVYFSVSFFAFIYWGHMQKSGRAQWNNMIHECANMVQNSFYTIGFLCKPPTSRP